MAVVKKTVGDLYSNRAFERVTQSAANTLTFSQVQFGTGLFQGVGLVLSRVEGHPSGTTLGYLSGDGDELEIAVTNRDDLTDLEADNQSVICRMAERAIASGTAASLRTVVTPFVIDLTNLPGGGLIIPANPIYVAVNSASLADVGVVDFVMYFTFKKLTDAEYIELLQTIMPANL